MKVLFVTPSCTGSGEAITAAIMAERLRARGDSVAAITSPSTAAFFSERSVCAKAVLTQQIDQNRRLWHGIMAETKPQVIVFADLPLMFFSSGVPPLADAGWLASLAGMGCAVTTLDHLGYAQGAKEVFFGPSHCSFHCESIPQTPEWISTLLPCPMQPPTINAPRRGIVFRYWDLPLLMSAESRDEVRRTYLEHPNDYLVFHAVPNWAWRIAEKYKLPLYSYLSRIYQRYFEGVSRCVTLVSVNNGNLLEPIDEIGFRVRNLSNLERREFDRLLLSADLMISENCISSTLGKAVCGRVPAVAICNSFSLLQIVEQADTAFRTLALEMERLRNGAVFPFEVYPIWTSNDLSEFVSWWGEDIETGIERVELFGGEVTRHRLQALLCDPRVRNDAHDHQTRFIKKAAELPAAEDVLDQEFFSYVDSIH